MNEINNPHDQFFKETFSHREVGIDFIKNYLPPEFVQTLDLDSLEILKDTFIDQELQSHFSDMVYKLRFVDGNEACIYILFEHKSYQEQQVSFQLLRYMVRIWEQQQRQNKKLTPIFPMVFYHGQAKWRISLNFLKLFSFPKVLEPYLLNYRYWLCDLSQYSDEGLKGAALLQVAMITMKYIFSESLKDELPNIFNLFQELRHLQTGMDYFECVFRYLMSSAETITEDNLRENVKKQLAEGGQIMGTIAQKYIDIGMEKGMEKGMERGKIIGLLDGIELVLEVKFGDTGIKEFAWIKQINDIKRLEKIRDSLKLVKTLEELRNIE